MRQNELFPPIEVWAWRGEHFVLDSHLRVAAARTWVAITSAPIRHAAPSQLDAMGAAVSVISPPTPVAAAHEEGVPHPLVSKAIGNFVRTGACISRRERGPNLKSRL
jgi:hypothetical protein